jgi:hypothetical protein
MKEKDLNKIAKFEKAIEEKYGTEAIQNPKSSWDKEKEQKYLEELKSFHDRSKRSNTVEQEDGFVIKTRKTAHQVERSCPICNSYSFSARDDIYMVKFGCCQNCYIQYIEDREERWKSGWRPNN